MIATVNRKRLIIAAAIVLLMVGGVSYGVSKPTAPDFTAYAAGAERKQAFFSYFLTLIEKRNQEILATREELLGWAENPDSVGWWDRGEVEDLATTYRLESFDLENPQDWEILLRRVDIVPASLALVQAAKESGWGTSRFAREASNYYGEWCFTQGCGLIPGGRAAGKTHEIATFDSAEDSVRGYMHNLNNHDAYTDLRMRRAQLREDGQPISGINLAGGLSKYSERGEAYVEEVRAMIKQNQLGQHD